MVPGAAAYEVAAHIALKKYLETVKGRARLGIQVPAVPALLFLFFISPTFFLVLSLERLLIGGGSVTDP